MKWFKIFSVVTVLLFAMSLSAQVLNVPQPFLAAGGILNGGGYTPFGGAVVGGIHISGAHFLLDPEAGYETGGKSNDADNTSSSGHTRYLKGNALVRIGKYYVGPGVSWSKLYTPDYTKGFVHPHFTVGRDFTSGYVSRVLIGYVQKGTDNANGIQGVEAQAYWFFGKSQHVFLRMDVQADFGHETVIPVSQGGSPSSVASELAQHIHTGSFQTIMGWRF